MCRHLVFSETFLELMGDALDQAPRVDEDDRGAVGVRVCHDAVVDVGVQLVRRDRTQLVAGDFDAEVECALMADVDDGAVGRAIENDPFAADQQTGDVLDGLLCGAQADALQAAAGKYVQPFQ